jgi:predicted RNase H-like HicB family nuclease
MDKIMKTAESFKLPPLTLILVEDSKLGGYTAFFRQLPDIISQGETEKEALQNLMNTVHDVFMFKSKHNDEGIDSSMHIIKRSVNFCSENYV